MLQNAAIDIAIGLILMYLVLSLVCTVINEFIATQLNLRAKSLAAGLNALIDDKTVRNAFYEHGVMAGMKDALKNSSHALSRATSLFGRGAPATATTIPAVTPAAVTPAAATSAAMPPSPQRVPGGGPDVTPPAAVVRPVATTPPAPPSNASSAPSQPSDHDHPSYVSAETFVDAMIGCLTGTSVAQGHPTPTFSDLQKAIEDLPPSKIKGALLANLVTAQGQLVKFQQGLSTWFDDSMERLSGAYKRHLKLISLIVGCLVAVVMNADTFAVGYALWASPAVRQQMVDLASQSVKNGLPNSTASGPDDVAAALKKADNQLRPMLPIGWPAALPTGGASAWPWFIATKLVGWAITGLALSLGAPFWFDLLGMLMNIRGAGPKPARADSKTKK
jgi:hypothetical protein